MIAPVWMLATVLGFAGPESVEPSELARRPDLIGKVVVVDDRIRYFLESKRGQGYDELLLKRSDVTFKLPYRLKFSRSPTEPNARVKGTPKLIDDRLIVEVLDIELLPNDVERLDRGIKQLRPTDWESLRTWALWAEKRGRELKDSKLEVKGIALEADALWLEASSPDADNLGLAARSSGSPIAISVRNALAHRGLRDRFKKATTTEDCEALAGQIETMLPKSVDPTFGSTAVEPAILEAYGREPGEAYRDASLETRSALDRKLLADVIQKSLELQLKSKPGDAAKLAAIAGQRLPDRPALAERLATQGLTEAESRVASMRQAEVEQLAAQFREQGEEDRAKRLLQSWLADRRKNRLSATDAEGRVLLATTYDKLLGDRATAAELIKEALAIDPQARGAVDTFLRMGFRKGDAGWYDPNAAQPDPAARQITGRKGGPGSGQGEPSESLKGLTRAQVRNRLGGAPDVVVRSASQGGSIEQWIYKNGRGTQVVRFTRETGSSEPRASAYYSDRK